MPECSRGFLAGSLCETRRHSTILAGICLIAACFLAYSNSFNVPFIFDDTGCIVENQSIRSLSDLRQVFSPPGAGFNVQGRPIVNLTFAINFAWSGLHIKSWHLVNTIIHALAGLLLFGIARRTLESELLPEWLKFRAHSIAFSISLLWIVHPLQTESVTYVVQRTESLAGLWILATLYCAIRAATSVRPVAWLSAANLTCALGMATKEVTFVAPLLVVIYDWIFSEQSLKILIRRRLPFYLGLASTWIILAWFIIDSEGRGTSAGFDSGMTSWDYLLTQCGFITHYLRLTFWPHPLVVDYGDLFVKFPMEIVPNAIVVCSLGAATIGTLIVRRFRPLGFLGVWFFFILAPSSSFVPLSAQVGAEHRMYLPLAAVLAATVVCAYWLFEHFWGERTCRRPDGILMSTPSGASQTKTQFGLRTVLVAGVVISLGVVTLRRNSDYQSAFSIWKVTAEQFPMNWRAHVNLGDEYTSRNDLGRANECFNKAIELNPRAYTAFNNRGLNFLRMGEFERGLADYKRAVEINPGAPIGHALLARALSRTGHLDAAIEESSEAIKLQPNIAEYWFERGELQFKVKHFDSAIADLSESIQLEPQFASAYNVRAACYRATHQLSSAIDDLTTAIEIKPQATYFLNRGIALGIVGRFEDSIADCSTAVQINPFLAPAFEARANSYHNLHRDDLAKKDLERARQLQRAAINSGSATHLNSTF